MIYFLVRKWKISIHAPREGGDGNIWMSRCCLPYFNPRPPRGGRRGRHISCSPQRHFNPRPPRGGRRRLVNASLGQLLFQSTPPARGATRLLSRKVGSTYISIHAPREGGDASGDGCTTTGLHFNPRPPQGGRLISRPAITQNVRFQSTPPSRGATSADAILPIYYQHFNPRPPRGGRLRWSRSRYGWSGYFNPRPPRGGRPLGGDDLTLQLTFQSTPPARGAT